MIQDQALIDRIIGGNAAQTSVPISVNEVIHIDKKPQIHLRQYNYQLEILIHVSSNVPVEQRTATYFATVQETSNINFCRNNSKKTVLGYFYTKCVGYIPRYSGICHIMCYDISQFFDAEMSYILPFFFFLICILYLRGIRTDNKYLTV